MHDSAYNVSVILVAYRLVNSAKLGFSVRADTSGPDWLCQPSEGMKGMREAVTCAVCSEVYQAGAREPLVLPCGHTFCRTCLASVKMTGNFLCPTCRQPHNNVQVDRLSVNYSLLSLSSACTDFEVRTPRLQDTKNVPRVSQILRCFSLDITLFIHCYYCV